MTLSTDLVIVDPVDPREVFNRALAMTARDFKGTPRWTHTDAGEGRGYTDAHYVTACGQGLPAWLWVHHASDGPLLLLVTPEDEAEWDETPPPCNAHCIRIDWDTGYSYRGPNGETCSQLHAGYIVEMGAWLDEKGLEWWWHNEFSGEWFRGAEGISTLVGSGEDARAWVTNTVEPAIRAIAATDDADGS